jgi:hypothetical protein
MKNEPQTKKLQVVFCIGKTMLVPHHQDPGIWVAPGGARHTAQELLDRGAFIGSYPLWGPEK